MSLRNYRTLDSSIIYGPVPSRRLGRSLGINNIPPKVCSFRCIYCQIGKTYDFSIQPQHFYDPVQIYELVADKVSHLRTKGEKIDYLAIVPDGEPTLDLNLGQLLNLLKSLGIPVAVITNGSLIDRESIQNILFKADWISFKLDSVLAPSWRRIDRPYSSIARGA